VTSRFDWAGLAATAAGAALPCALIGFGFAVPAAPLVLLFVDPPQAIQLVIIISTALSFVTPPGLRPAVADGAAVAARARQSGRFAVRPRGFPVPIRSSCAR
jgi:hypothetical protein